MVGRTTNLVVAAFLRVPYLLYLMGFRYLESTSGSLRPPDFTLLAVVKPLLSWSQTPHANRNMHGSRVGCGGSVDYVPFPCARMVTLMHTWNSFGAMRIYVVYITSQLLRMLY